MRNIKRFVARTRWYVWVAGAVVLVMAASWFSWLRAGYSFLDWSGFGSKTVWNVLELLIIPLTLAGVAAYLDKLERKTDREIALSNQREAALQNYFNFMTDLVLEKGLHNSQFGDEIQKIAQVKTDTTLDGLDPERKGKVIKFLGQLFLLSGNETSEPTISLQSANLKKAPLVGCALADADLVGANLEAADLKEAYLARAKLVGANLGQANLSWTMLACANLNKANLAHATLVSTDLAGVNLRQANLANAKMIRASFQGADLREAKLESLYSQDSNFQDANLALADLTNAVLHRADFWQADLRSANFTQTDLSGANLAGANLTGAIFTDAIMPDWEKYDPSVHTIEELTIHYPARKAEAQTSP